MRIRYSASFLILLIFFSFSFIITTYFGKIHAIEETPPQGVIVYDTDAAGLAQIFRINADGTDDIALTDGTVYSYAAHFNVEREQYVLIAEVDEENFYSDIFVMDADGGNVTRITFEEYGSVIARWSPDGEHIVFTASDTNDFIGDLFIMNADGENLTNLTNTPEINEFDPMWSPIADEIVFSSDESGFLQIHLIDIDGQNERRLTSDSGQRENYQPAWSPDGQQIAYVSRLDTNANVYVMDVDGDTQIQVTDYDGVLQTEYPIWSPDGRHIVYGVFDADGFQTMGIDIVTISSRQTQTLLTGSNEFLYVADWIAIQE